MVIMTEGDAVQASVVTELKEILLDDNQRKETHSYLQRIVMLRGEVRRLMHSMEDEK